MRVISTDEQEKVSGGNPLVALAAVVLIYEAANIAYEFGQGFVDGFKDNIK